MDVNNIFKEKWKNAYFKLKVLFHILFFSLLGYMVLFGYNYSLETYFSKRFFSSDVFVGFTIISLSYLFFYLILRRDYVITLKIKWLLICCLFFLLLAVNEEYHNWLLVPSYYQDLTQLGYIVELEFSFVEVLTNFLIYIGSSCILLSLIWFIENLESIFNARFFKRKDALKKARSKQLRQQLNPHFLFNALNSIYSMSLTKHPQTPDIILKLSSMMRYLTDHSNLNLVNLSSEIKFIQEYISLEKIRFGEEANIFFITNGIEHNVLIEPLMLITLVENAFKHGFYTNDKNSFVSINLSITNNILVFKVENTIQVKQHFHKENRNGKGIENLRTRLKLSYPKTSELNLLKENKTFKAELKIAL